MNLAQIWASEPVMVVAGAGAIAAALLAALITFGVPITPDQKLALLALGSTIITVISGLVARSQVSPVATLPLPPHG
jgi:hypothetical protein